MGYRTVVMLNNDVSDRWARDPKLGEKIQHAMNFAGSKDPERADWARLGNYGRVVECVHADTQTLVRLDRYINFDSIAYTSQQQGVAGDDNMVKLLKEAADKLGYRLVKKPVKG